MLPVEVLGQAPDEVQQPSALEGEPRAGETLEGDDNADADANAEPDPDADDDDDDDDESPDEVVEGAEDRAIPDGAVPEALRVGTPVPEQVPRWEWLGNPLAPRSRGPKGRQRSTPHRFLPLPSFRSQPAVGLMLGASLNYAYRKSDDEPNRVYLYIESRVSLRNVQEHGFVLRLRDLLGYREIFELGAGARRDPVYPYYGVANHTNLRGVDLEGRFYQTLVNTSGGFFTYQHPVWNYKAPGRQPMGTLRTYSGFAYYVDKIGVYKDTLFAKERPHNEGVTRRGTLRLGLVWDRRDNEWSPATGALHDLTFDAAGPWTGSTHTWGRVHGSMRHYWQLGVPGLVLAHRFTYDVLWGDPPFVTLGEFGGLAAVDGLGGSAIGRGWMRRRFIGRHKAYGSVEVRFQPVEIKLRGHTLGIGLKGFVDLGMVSERLRNLPLQFLVSGGPGLLLLWDHFAVIRIDGGFSRETSGFYLMTEHAF